MAVLVVLGHAALVRKTSFGCFYNRDWSTHLYKCTFGQLHLVFPGSDSWYYLFLINTTVWTHGGKARGISTCWHPDHTKSHANVKQANTSCFGRDCIDAKTIWKLKNGDCLVSEGWAGQRALSKMRLFPNNHATNTSYLSLEPMYLKETAVRAILARKCWEHGEDLPFQHCVHQKEREEEGMNGWLSSWFLKGTAFAWRPTLWRSVAFSWQCK